MASRDFARNIECINPIQRKRVNHICKYLVAKGRQDIARKLVVFGSSTTDKATEESDIDIAVEFFNPERRIGADGKPRYVREDNNRFISWVRFVTEECGASIIDMDDLREHPAEYYDGIPEAVASGVVVYEGEEVGNYGVQL